MRFAFLLLVLFCALGSCSTKRENTYEENLALCTKRLGHYPPGTDTTGLTGADAKSQFEYEIRECMKGSVGPDFMVKTDRGDSVSTKPVKARAMVLFFWMAITPDAPIEFKRSNTALFAAMNSLHHKYKNRVDFLGFPYNDSLTTNQYLKEHPLNFPQVDDGKTADMHTSLTQKSYPYIIFINTQGRVMEITTGSLSRQQKIIDAYEPVLQACIDNKPYNN